MILLAYVLAATLTTPPAFETTPPPPSAPRQTIFPRIAEQRLPNGVRVVVVQRPQAPLCSISMIIGTGSSSDPDGLEGLADIADTLLGKDTRMNTSIEDLGAKITSGVDVDHSHVLVDAILPEQLGAVLQELADAMRSRAFRRGADAEADDVLNDEDELELAVKRSRDRVRDAARIGTSIGARAALRIVYPNVYGRPVNGTKESLARITSESVGAYRTRAYRPDNLTIIMAGNIDLPRAVRTVRRAFGAWHVDEPPPPRVVVKDFEATRHVVVIDMPAATEATVRVGMPALRFADDQDELAEVVGAMLWSDKSALLTREIRVRRGLAYTPVAGFDLHLARGPFWALAETNNTTAVEVTGIILDELEKFRAADVGERDLQRYVNASVGRFYLSLEKTSNLAEYVETQVVSGRAIRPFSDYSRRMAQITQADVKQFAAKYLDISRASIVIVGDAKLIVPALRQRFADDVTVIPISEVDLNSPSLGQEPDW